MGQYIRDSKLINQFCEAEFVNLSTSSSIEEIGRGGLNKIISLFKIQVSLLKKLKSSRFDCVYFTISASGSGFYKDLVVLFLIKLFGNEVLFHFHNKGVKLNSRNLFSRALYRYCFKRSKSILLSRFLYSDIDEFVAEENVYYCANGIPSIDAVPQNLSKSNERCRILFLSNLIREKGVYVLIEACSILKNWGVDFECDFLGDWGDITRKDFENYVFKLNLQDRVKCHGKKLGEEKVLFLREADVFAFPTFYRNECFPLVLLEAMQFGLPIVSTTEGGIQDIVIDGKTGFIVPKNSAQHLAEKLRTLIDSPSLRSKMGSEGRCHYLKSFSIDKFEERFVSILAEFTHTSVKL